LLTASLIVGFLTLVSSPAAAQPAAAKSQPDRLTLGRVFVDATVEASVRVMVKGADTAGVEVRTKPPEFLKVTETRLATQTYGQLGTFVVYDVLVSVDTQNAGDFRGKLKVSIGDQDVEVPVDVKILDQEPDLRRVLVVETPFHRFSTGDATLFEPWLELVKSARLDVHYLEVDHGRPVLRDLDLSKFDVVLLAGDGLMSARENDFERLRTFVSDGGRVILAANHFFVGTVEKANEFLASFGLRMSDVETPGINLYQVDGEEIAEDPLTAGVESLRFFRPSPVAVEDQDKGKVLVGAPPYPDEGFVAVANAESGQVVALGMSLWWNWIASPQEAESDNAKLLKNLLSKRAAPTKKKK
jgi:hypothetical protein